MKKAAKTIKTGFIVPLHKGSSNKFAFAKDKGKHAGTTTRLTKKGMPYRAAKREILYGPTIAELYTNKKAEAVIIETIDTDFQITLDENFSKQFEKRR